MITEMFTQRSALTTGLHGVRELRDANQTAEMIKSCWRNGETPDVAAALANHPKLRCYKTVVLDLAYQEYIHHLQAGEKIDAETFSRRFPSFQKSLQFFIAFQSLISGDPADQTAQGVVSWPEPGSQFLEFDLLAEIGRGSFGRVFLATEPALGGRQVVVKVAPQGGEEADTLGKLCHPNIVPVYSLQKDATGLAAFCMPYLGQATLCDILDYAFLDSQPPKQASIILDAVAAVDNDSELRESPRPDAILRKGSYVDGVIDLVAQLADALAHSHERGICHRDLKPSNVLMTSDGRPLLLDFNLSVDPSVLAARIGGTLPYMAPEELAILFEPSRDVRRHYDPRSDLFSLGVIAYELLTGTLPFGPITPEPSLEKLACQLYQRQKEGPRPLQEQNRQVDSRLAVLIERCLAFEPDQRPETAHKLAAALHKELTLVQRSCRWMRNHPKLVGTTATIILAWSLAVALFFALRPPYSVRQLQLGLADIARGDNMGAVRCLNNSLLVNPDSAEALFARGCAYQHLGEFQSAFQDYRLVYQQTHDPALNVCKGYCLNRMNSHRAAIVLYLSALEVGYDSPALLYNNIGYSYLMVGQMDDAEKYLQLAIAMDENLQAPHYSLVKVFLRRAFQGQPIPDAAFVHATKAIEIGPQTADLYRVVAILYAKAAIHHPTLVQPAIKYVEKAVALGCSPKTIASDPICSVLQKEPAFHKALKIRCVASTSLEVTQLLDPLATP